MGSMAVLHRCDNPACVEPAHLFLGTIADNNADRHAKGRDARGEANGQAKLSEHDVERIRALKGQLSQRAIGKIFGVTGQAVNLIHNNQRRSLPAATP
jgi:hypothetical protein